MEKSELKSLTIQQLEDKSEEELYTIAQEVVQKLSNREINHLPDDVLAKLHIEKDKTNWLGVIVTMVLGALAAAIVSELFSN